MVGQSRDSPSLVETVARALLSPVPCTDMCRARCQALSFILGQFVHVPLKAGSSEQPSAAGVMQSSSSREVCCRWLPSLLPTAPAPALRPVAAALATQLSPPLWSSPVMWPGRISLLSVQGLGQFVLALTLAQSYRNSSLYSRHC